MRYCWCLQSPAGRSSFGGGFQVDGAGVVRLPGWLSGIPVVLFFVAFLCFFFQGVMKFPCWGAGENLGLVATKKSA
jgi:hypothetical protein